jgi:hypothetical protein
MELSPGNCIVLFQNKAILADEHEDRMMLEMYSVSMSMSMSMSIPDYTFFEYSMSLSMSY